MICSSIASLKFQNTNPERGRKRAVDHAIAHVDADNFRTRTPKGDGNVRPSDLLLRAFEFQNTNPERGRKRNETRLDEPLDPLLISEHEPRKGTETAKCVMQGITSTNFRTRTPKGDGNVIGCAIVTPMS